MQSASAWSTAERAARDAYGRLLAALAYRFRDIAAAEDALGDALRQALETWPSAGIPRSPEAWLMTVAKNGLRQAARHRSVTLDPRTTAVLESGFLALEPARGAAVDSRLNLMFVCAHPAIDPALRTPLMLQTVLGLDAGRIGSAFLVPGSTMGQRLVRAKQKIRDAAIPFEPPEGHQLAERLSAVLEGIYAAFGAAWDESSGQAGAREQANEPHEPLADEALFLGRLLTELVPDEPEALGLLALLTFSHARRGARFDAQGRFVPLAAHDLTLWDRRAILDADALLLRAAALRRPGSFQLEAAIQSAHCQRLFSGHTPWTAISTLYEALNRSAPTVGSRVAQAAALAELGKLDEAGRTPVGTRRKANSQLRALLGRGRSGGRGPRLVDVRRGALQRAISLTRDAALRAYLEGQLDDALPRVASPSE